MTSVWNAILVDTNVLVYPYDPRDRVKRERAVLVLDAVVAGGRGVLSVQCLTEFFNAATRRLPERMSRAEAKARVERLARVYPVLPLTPAIVLEGCRGAAEHQLSFWDALIWASARLNQVPWLLTEDAPHWRFLEGVRYLNPFSLDFDLALVGA